MTNALRGDAQDVQLSNCRHAGLLLERWLSKAESGGGDKPALNKLHNTVCNVQPGSFYEQCFQRWFKEFEHLGVQRGAVAICQIKAVSRVLIGAGAHTVLETGLAIHHTYGVPYLPGSSLKGLARRYCREVLGGQGSEAGEDPQRKAFQAGGDLDVALFGTAHPGDVTERGEDTAGLVSFHDALYVPGSARGKPFGRDVLTPHHSKYNVNGGAAPTDYDSPIPHSFIAVRPDAEFQIVLETFNDSAAWSKWMLERVLLPALGSYGLGGKTAAGYGRFRRIKDSLKLLKPKVEGAVGLEDFHALFNTIKKGDPAISKKERLRPHCEKLLDIITKLDDSDRGRAIGAVVRYNLKRLKRQSDSELMAFYDKLEGLGFNKAKKPVIKD